MSSFSKCKVKLDPLFNLCSVVLQPSGKTFFVKAGGTESNGRILFNDEHDFMGEKSYFVRAGDNLVVINIGQSTNKSSSAVSATILGANGIDMGVGTWRS
ncbi:hypothetical protein CTheo_7232 [Ceratobasidium theobromae]|uniref:Uncharacterized protein n=1 Tax=Ceratobasidium theobromae TaxID=1582974 RepID=A0A5N5QC54_9AGAM|nr:hypothetical protein CTheo_7232 [Ceratobasidium theobromae]